MPNKIYQISDSAFEFKETASSGLTFSPKNVANGAGRVSDQKDLGATAKSRRYKWEATMESASNITLGLGIRIYLGVAERSSSKNPILPGTTTDSAITAEDQFNNGVLIGQVLSAGTAAGTGPFHASGELEISGRYVRVGYWNASGQTLVNTDDKAIFTLTPIPDEIQ